MSGILTDDSTSNRRADDQNLVGCQKQSDERPGGVCLSFLRGLAVSLVICLAVSVVAARCQEVDSSAHAIRFPLDAKIVDVRKDYGALGDGVTDDTGAIQRAIAEDRGKYQRTLYFPEGTYIVSNTLDGKTDAGIWRSRVTFQGAGRDRTTIRLRDSSPMFGDPKIPKPVLATGSIEPWDKATGSGYNGFRNYILDLTIDVGTSNPGATGIDYLGNNVCGFENVRIKSSDPQYRGFTGLDMERTYVGPCLYKNLEIDGFDYGIRTRQKEYSHTFDHLTLRNQRIAGINNTANVLSIYGLSADESVPVLQSDSPDGLITIIQAELRGRNGQLAAIVNNGHILLRDIRVSGYGGTLANQFESKIAGNIDNYMSKQLRGGSAANKRVTLDLPIEEAPRQDLGDISRWKNVISAGAVPDGKTDCTAALQRAFNADVDALYLPPGDYIVSNSIVLRGPAKKIIGFGAVILPKGPNFADPANGRPVFVLQPNASVLTIENIQFGWNAHKDYGGAIWMENDTDHTIVLRHVDFQGVANMVYRTGPTGTGRLFLEDVEGSGWEFRGPQSIWARQLDLEGHSDLDKIVNHGASLWILGLKTEGVQTVIRTDGGGRTEVLGALIYPVHPPEEDRPAFIIQDSAAALVYATSANRAATNYAVQVRVLGRASHDLRASDVAPRGAGSVAAVVVDASGAQ